MIYYSLFCHWVADFICQSRRMGENKSKDFNVLVEHCLVYTFILFVMLMIPLGVLVASKISIINGAAHLIIDGITSKITSYFYKENKMHLFFSTIGFDQFMHMCILIWSVNYFIT